MNSTNNVCSGGVKTPTHHSADIAEDEQQFDAGFVLEAVEAAERDGRTPDISYFDATAALQAITARQVVVEPNGIRDDTVSDSATNKLREKDSEDFDAQIAFGELMAAHETDRVVFISYFNASVAFECVWNKHFGGRNIEEEDLSDVDNNGAVAWATAGNADAVFDPQRTLDILEAAYLIGNTAIFPYFDSTAAFEYILTHPEAENRR